MKGNIEERACRLACYIIENKATVRGAAQKFGISKSTVHKDLSERLPAFNRTLYLQVKQVLEKQGPAAHSRRHRHPKQVSRRDPVGLHPRRRGQRRSQPPPFCRALR